MRIVFIGSVDFSLQALERWVAQDAEIVGVCALQKSTFNADHVDLIRVSAAFGFKAAEAFELLRERL